MRMSDISRVCVREWQGVPHAWTVELKDGMRIEYERVDNETGEILPLYGDELPRAVQKFCFEYDVREDAIASMIYEAECYMYERSV